MFDMSSPVYTEVQFALVFELRQQLLLRLPNSHSLSEHSIQKELAGLSKQNNTLHVHNRSTVEYEKYIHFQLHKNLCGSPLGH